MYSKVSNVILYFEACWWTSLFKVMITLNKNINKVTLKLEQNRGTKKQVEFKRWHNNEPFNVSSLGWSVLFFGFFICFNGFKSFIVKVALLSCWPHLQCAMYLQSLTDYDDRKDIVVETINTFVKDFHLFREVLKQSLEQCFCSASGWR